MGDASPALYDLGKLPAHVQANIEVCPCYDCWLWKGDINNRGYARVKVWGTRYLGHRFMYEYFVRPLASLDGMGIDHTCTTRGCVNPAHLEAVTHQENIQRMYARRG